MSAALPAPRLRLSLRWKAFCAMLLLLSLVHGAFGFLVYRQQMHQYRQQEGERLGAYSQQLTGLLQQAAHALGTVGAQIASDVSLAQAARQPFDTSQLAPEVLANLSDLRVFDLAGHAVGGIAATAAVRLPETQERALLDAARRTHQPALSINCAEECVQYEYEPAFDRDGVELIIGLGQPVAETLREFARQSGADVALLATAAQTARAPGRRSLAGRSIFAITDAPRLLPWLRATAAQLSAAPANQPYAASDGRSAALTLSTPLDGTAGVEALFILDETGTLSRIREGVRAGLLSSLAGLTLSAAALWLFLTPLSRRLRGVTRALPLLAEQKFAESRALLPPSGGGRFADELDLLTQTTQWLSYRLERLNAAEAASAAKSRHLAELSHEVRTPLHGILGMLELLQHSSLDPAQCESLRMVHESAQSLLRIVDDTLDLARIEAGRIELDSAPFSLVHVVEGCVETFASRARGKGLRLINYVDPALPSLLLGDAMRLRQILSNLCNNAVKFTAAGRIAVSARLAGAGPDRVSVAFLVQDTGIGITPQALALLFQPFRQASAATAANYGGSGLGLSICKGLVERMGGQITCHSAPGMGTTFRIVLEFPLAPAGPEAVSQRLDGIGLNLQILDDEEREWIAGYLQAAGAHLAEGALLQLGDEGDGIRIESAALHLHLPHPLHRSALLRSVAQAAGFNPLRASEAAAAASPGRRLRLLAVDDHPTNRHVIEQQLVLLGHQVELAADGEEALHRLEFAPFDALLTDLRMPGLDGYGLAREIRRREAAGTWPGRLPILALTAQVAADDEAHCAEAGMDGCLSKPCSLEQLRRALSPWCGAVVDNAPAARDDGAELPLDRAFLSSLVGGDTELAEQLSRDFIRINTPLLAELLHPDLDMAGLQALAHRLLGSARTVGARQLARLMSDLEAAAERQQASRCRTLAQQAGEEFARVRDYLTETATT